MNDLTILHLSDLHIDGQAAYPEILKNLLVHIKEEIAPTREKTLVVAVTGDIIDKGNKAAIDNAKKFFEDLKKLWEIRLLELFWFREITIFLEVIHANL